MHLVDAELVISRKNDGMNTFLIGLLASKACKFLPEIVLYEKKDFMPSFQDSVFFLHFTQVEAKRRPG